MPLSKSCGGSTTISQREPCRVSTRLCGKRIGWAGLSYSSAPRISVAMADALIESKSLERDAGEKPVPTFSHPALEIRHGKQDA